ncbi:MAG: hypothetical protein NTV52_34465 [Acidobacteria bacterium]|nr:hypothetical protein [Acidobacteriota bacterium]
MIFVVTPLVVAALLGLGWDRRYARLLTGLIVGLIVAALVTWWALIHMVMGDRTSGLARMIFARPWAPGVVGPTVGFVIALAITRYHRTN